MTSSHFMHTLRAARVDIGAVTALEYAIIAGMIATAVVVSVHAYANSMNGLFNYVAANL